MQKPVNPKIERIRRHANEVKNMLDSLLDKQMADFVIKDRERNNPLYSKKLKQFDVPSANEFKYFLEAEKESIWRKPEKVMRDLERAAGKAVERSH